jgi:hypothetical protein
MDKISYDEFHHLYPLILLGLNALGTRGLQNFRWNIWRKETTLEDRGIDGRIILKGIFVKLVTEMGNGFNWLEKVK